MPRPTVLLLHAFPLDARMWDGVAPALAEAGYEVVAPDLPGEEVELGFPAWAARVLGLVEGPFVPVGSSMGGYLAFELWRQAPGRIAAMALVGSRATPDSPEQRLARDDSIQLLGERGREPFWEELAPRLFADGADPAALSRAHELALEQPVTALVATQETIRDRVDSRPTLATIDVPVLVLVGEEDRLTPPADAEAMAAGLSAARLARIPGAGHLAPVERPDAVAGELVAFLREVDA
ncbi:MAG TPA: alpha/beta fold hydrolase [Gaiellaceae bacterium]|nr:alpha/beta fold hydrolase [Gaiellaceae bacterium]